MVLEVMGRDAGYIALSAGIAGGADVILIPEIPYTLEAVCAKIDERAGAAATSASSWSRNRCAARPASRSPTRMPTASRAMAASAHAGAPGRPAHPCRDRVTVLGHVQRGGSPAPLDRVLASAFGVSAVDLIAAGRFDRMVAWQNRAVVDVAIEEAVAQYQVVDPDDALVHTARGPRHRLRRRDRGRGRAIATACLIADIGGTNVRLAPDRRSDGRPTAEQKLGRRLSGAGRGGACLSRRARGEPGGVRRGDPGHLRPGGADQLALGVLDQRDSQAALGSSDST